MNCIGVEISVSQIGLLIVVKNVVQAFTILNYNLTTRYEQYGKHMNFDMCRLRHINPYIHCFALLQHACCSYFFYVASNKTCLVLYIKRFPICSTFFTYPFSSVFIKSRFVFEEILDDFGQVRDLKINKSNFIPW